MSKRFKQPQLKAPKTKAPKKKSTTASMVPLEAAELNMLKFQVGDKLPPDEPEGWVPIGSEFPDAYISTLGRVWSEQKVVSNRSRTVSLKSTEGKQVALIVASQVALVFLGLPGPNQTCQLRCSRSGPKLSNVCYGPSQLSEQLTALGFQQCPKFQCGSQLPNCSPERWFPVDTFPDTAVSSAGRVFTGNKIMSYSMLRMPTHSGRIQNVRAHVVIAEAFLGPTPRGHHIAFKDATFNSWSPSNLAFAPNGELLEVNPETFVIGLPLPFDYPETWYWIGSKWPEAAISTLGRVRHGLLVLREQKSLQYRVVTLKDIEGNVKQVKIHKLMAETFFGPRPEGCEIAHDDDVGSNNHLSNVSYQTISDNRKQIAAVKRRPVIVTAVNHNRSLAFDSITDAAKYFEKKPAFIRQRCKSGCSFAITYSDSWWCCYADSSKLREREVADNALEWRPVLVPSYECSSKGHFRRTGGRYVLAQQYIPNGYNLVSLRKDGRRFLKTVHKCVCETFHGTQPTAAHQVNHMNENKRDNHQLNLEWNAHNVEYSRGRPCECMLDDGTWEWFPSIRAAQRQTGAKAISHVLRGKQLTSGGRRWRRADKR